MTANPKESENMKKNLSGILTGILTVLGLLLSVGVQLVFHACGAGEDGSYMSCHWAQMAVVAIGAVIAVTGAAALAVRDRKIRMGLVAAVIPAALAAVLVPNVLIRLCMMDTMHCNHVMRPAVLIFGILAMIISAADVAICGREAVSCGGEKR